MRLLLAFMATVLCGLGATVVVAIEIERVLTPSSGLAVFFPLMVLTIWGAWRLAVRMTAPASDRAGRPIAQ